MPEVKKLKSEPFGWVIVLPQEMRKSSVGLGLGKINLASDILNLDTHILMRSCLIVGFKYRNSTKSPGFYIRFHIWGEVFLKAVIAWVKGPNAKQMDDLFSGV